MGRIVAGICAGLLAICAASAAPAEAIETKGSAGFETDAPYSSCLVYPFPLGSASIKQDEIRQSPPGCLDSLKRAVERSETRLLILSGRSHSHDRPKPSRDPNWRAALGVEWARALLKSLPAPAKKVEAVLLASGPYHTPSTPETCELERSVAIRAYWGDAKSGAAGDPPKKEGGLFSRGEMEPDVAVSVLSLLVALSAYLAAVLLSVYVFFAPGPGLLRWALGLAVLSGAVLVLFHALESIKSWSRTSQGKNAVPDGKA